MAKRLSLVIVALTCVVSWGFSQGSTLTGSVIGKITDSAGKQNLGSASVSVMSVLDDGPHAFVVADKDGSFVISSLPQGTYRLLVSFEGYQHLDKRFSISDAHLNVDFGVLNMQKQSDSLKAVVVEEPGVKIKQDTVEYNAEKYAVKPNALAEDLLKKLPGVLVDRSGNITAQGETVTRVMVNGRRFFSDDPKLATRNLPPEIIDKIQVFDDLSDQSKFTGFDDGNRVKTINIITKKNAQQGYFGKAVGSIGTDQDYDESVNMHRFDGNQQVSVLGQANDINKQNFTIQDILGSSGSRRGNGGAAAAATNQSSPGITTVWAGGANYRDNWGKNIDAYGSYFFNFQHVATYTQDTLLKQFGDSSNYGGGGSQNIQKTENHRIYFNLEDRFDSSNSLIFRPNFTYQTTTPHGSSYSSSVDNLDSPVNKSMGYTSSVNSGFNINNSNIQFRHKFNKQYQTMSLDLSGTANTNDGSGYQYSVNDYYQLPGGLETQTINQYYNDTLHSYTISPTFSFTQPVGKNKIIEFNYNYTYIRSTTINNTYDFSDTTNTYSMFDSLFSNSYRFTSHANRFTLNYRIQNPKFNLSLGSGIQFTKFISFNTTKDITVAPPAYINFTPTVNFQYSFSSTQRFRLNYMGRTGTPTPSQLQPLVTTSDDVNFTSGNPNLKPQFTHTLRMLYASFDPSTQHTIFATINASAIVNDIQNWSIPTVKGGDSTTYVNLNGTYNLSGFFNYGIALKKPKSNLNFITNISYSQFQNLQDTGKKVVVVAHNYSKSTTLGETLSWTTNIKKNFDMNFSSASSYTFANNSIQSSVPLNYFSETISTEFTAYSNNGWLAAASFDYTYTDTKVQSYNASIPLLTPSIAKQLFKKKNGELRFTVFDVLNKNTYVNKSVVTTPYSGFTINRTNALSRYAMLTFTYNLNNFAGTNQRRMPGMFNNNRRFGNGGGGRNNFE